VQIDTMKYHEEQFSRGVDKALKIYGSNHFIVETANKFRFYFFGPPSSLMKE